MTPGRAQRLGPRHREGCGSEQECPEMRRSAGRAQRTGSGLGPGRALWKGGIKDEDGVDGGEGQRARREGPSGPSAGSSGRHVRQGPGIPQETQSPAPGPFSRTGGAARGSWDR